MPVASICSVSDGARLHDAITFATQAHKGQVRKGTYVDYICHPLEVLQILTAMESDLNLLIAGVLHDTVEDTAVSLPEIEARFGPDVAMLAAHHSEDKSRSWKERKTHAISSVQQGDIRLKKLVLADKVSNLRSIAADRQQVGEQIWDRFNAPREEQAWYYRGIGSALSVLSKEKGTAPFYAEFDALCYSTFL